MSTTNGSKHGSNGKAAAGPVRTAIVGLGRAGWNIHARALRTLPELFALELVTDPDSGRLDEARAAFGCRAASRFEDVVDDPDVELVVVASPSHLHTHHTISALAAGKHVVCEKPFALDVESADRMIAAHRTHGRVLAPFQNRRYESHYRKVVELIGSGVLGEVLLIRMCWHRFTRRWDWQTLKEFGGGALYNNGTHLLDQALAMLGPRGPDVFVDLRRGLSLGDADEHMKLVLRDPDGPTVDIEFTNACAYEQDRWHIMGTNGGLRGTTDRLEWKSAEWSAMPERRLELGPARGRRYPNEEIAWRVGSWEPDPSEPQPYELLYRDVFGAIRRGEPLTVTPESARRYVDILDRCSALAAAH